MRKQLRRSRSFRPSSNGLERRNSVSTLIPALPDAAVVAGTLNSTDDGGAPRMIANPTVQDTTTAPVPAQPTGVTTPVPEPTSSAPETQVVSLADVTAIPQAPEPLTTLSQNASTEAPVAQPVVAAGAADTGGGSALAASRGGVLLKNVAQNAAPQPTGPKASPGSAQAGLAAGFGSGIRKMTLAPSSAPQPSAVSSGGAGVGSGSSVGSASGSGGGSGGGSASAIADLRAGWGEGGYPGGWALGGSGGGGGTGWGSASGSGSSSASLASPFDGFNPNGPNDDTVYMVNSGGGWNKRDGSGIDVIGGIGGCYINDTTSSPIASVTLTVQNAVASQSFNGETGETNTPLLTITSSSPPGQQGFNGGSQWYWNNVYGWDSATQSFDHTVTAQVTLANGSVWNLTLNNKVETPKIVLDPVTLQPEYTAQQQAMTFLQAQDPGGNWIDYLTSDTPQAPGIYFNATVSTVTLNPGLAASRYPWGNFTFRDEVIPNDTAIVGGVQYTIGPKTAGTYMLNNDGDPLLMDSYLSPNIFPAQQGTLPQVGNLNDPFRSSPMMVDDNPGFAVVADFVNNYVNGTGPYLTSYHMNDTFRTYLMYQQEAGIEYAIGYLDWSISGTITFNDGEGGTHTAAYYTDPANWTVTGLSPSVPTTWQGVVVASGSPLGTPIWDGDANNDLSIT